MPFLDSDGDGWVICDLPLSPARPWCDCQPSEPTIYPGASCFTGLPGVCSTGSYNCGAGPGSCVQTIFPSAEICDGKDNNCNGAIDEGNPGGGVPCSTGLSGICNNGTTNCAGGAIVCSQTTLPQVEVCNGLDDNCNGATDEGLGSTTCGLGVCAHVQQNCVGGVPRTCNPFQGASLEVCNDGLDNDCDGLTDCADPNCSTHPSCVVIPPTENCSNGIDDDGDGLIDCFDADCTFDPACAIGGPENCSNGIDDDGDGLIDCADPDCRGFSCGSGCICAYKVKQENNCTDGIDNDGDGLTDCADPMCAALPVCGGGNENCADGVDNDGDGFADCFDAACQLHPRCIPWDAPGGAIPWQVCNTLRSPPCHAGRTTQGPTPFTCKPITLSCY